MVAWADAAIVPPTGPATPNPIKYPREGTPQQTPWATQYDTRPMVVGWASKSLDKAEEKYRRDPKMCFHHSVLQASDQDQDELFYTATQEVDNESRLYFTFTPTPYSTVKASAANG